MYPSVLGSSPTAINRTFNFVAEDVVYMRVQSMKKKIGQCIVFVLWLAVLRRGEIQFFTNDTISSQVVTTLLRATYSVHNNFHQPIFTPSLQAPQLLLLFLWDRRLEENLMPNAAKEDFSKHDSIENYFPVSILGIPVLPGVLD